LKTIYIFDKTVGSPTLTYNSSIQLSGLPALPNQGDFIISKDGNNLYVFNTSNYISHYSRDPATNLLTFVQVLTLPSVAGTMGGLEAISENVLFSANQQVNKDVTTGNISVNSQPASIALGSTQSYGVASSDNKHVYTVNSGGLIYQYSI